MRVIKGVNYLKNKDKKYAIPNALVESKIIKGSRFIKEHKGKTREEYCEPMTPDEVVKVLKLMTKGHGATDFGEALQCAVTLLQDYQKLREKIDEGKIEAVVNSAILFDANIKPIHKLTNSIVTALVTYLQQPTEH